MKTRTAAHAWIIDHDHLRPPTDTGSAMGTTGPSRAPDTAVICLQNDFSYGRRFRMGDGQEWHYSGRLMMASGLSQEDGPVEWFAPLDEFGRGSGCTTIEYYQHGEWVEV